MITRTLKLLPLVFLVGACGAPESVALDAVCTPANDGKNVAVRGYLRPSISVYCSSTSDTFKTKLACGLYLIESPKREVNSRKDLSIRIFVGDGANEMDKPSHNLKNLTIRTADNSPVVDTKMVSVSGEATVSGAVCSIKANEIKNI